MFGHLKFVREVQATKKSRIVECICQCGKYKTFHLGSLTSGSTISCGCRSLSNVTTHGMRARGQFTPEYRCWLAMKDRCLNRNNKSWKYYGGRGITVCHEWATDFTAFLRDVGTRPGLKYSVDRWPNKDGNYEPGNVRWATHIQQVRNRRDNVLLELNGENKTMGEWADLRGVNRSLIRCRIDLGWPVDLAINTPPRGIANLPSHVRVNAIKGSNTKSTIER